MILILMTDLLNSILPYGETTDMQLVTRLHKILKNKELSLKLLNEYNFWYNNTNQVFWSENHYIMNVSSEYILREILNLPITPELYERLVTFLDIKINIGFAEFLSPVYLPFTITSLLNLYDNTKNKEIKEKCRILVDTLAYQILSVSLEDGTLISPSGRSYIRHRKTTRTHLNYFIDFLLKGTNIVNEGPEMALKEILSITTYRPSSYVYSYLKGKQSITINISKSLEELLANLENKPIDIYCSILWNYCLYFPSQKKVLKIVIKFMDTYNLWSHPHFKALKTIRKLLCSVNCATLLLLPLSKLVKNISDGALLLNVSVCIYKEKKFCLVSTKNYNEGLPTFQQWTLTLNLTGMPIWFSYGKISNGGISLGNKEANNELSTARITPYISQDKNKVTAHYKAKNFLLNIYNRKCAPEIYWDKTLFDETGIIDNWNFGIKDNTIIAYQINKNKVNLVVESLEEQTRSNFWSKLSS